MHPITFLGLAILLGVLFFRARQARNKPASTPKQRFDTAHVLIGALIVWLIVSFNLQHLDRSLSGEPQSEPSTFEKVIRTLSDWI